MDLAAPIEDVKGIGPKTAEVLHKAGFFTLKDLLYHLPRDYESFQQAQNISELRPGQVTIRAKIEDIKLSRRRRGLTPVLYEQSGGTSHIARSNLMLKKNIYFLVRWIFLMVAIRLQIRPPRSQKITTTRAMARFSQSIQCAVVLSLRISKSLSRH